jgi:hypothetical protein
MFGGNNSYLKKNGLKMKKEMKNKIKIGKREKKKERGIRWETKR